MVILIPIIVLLYYRDELKEYNKSNFAHLIGLVTASLILPLLFVTAISGFNNIKTTDSFYPVRVQSNQSSYFQSVVSKVEELSKTQSFGSYDIIEAKLTPTRYICKVLLVPFVDVYKGADFNYIKNTEQILYKGKLSKEVRNYSNAIKVGKVYLAETDQFKDLDFSKEYTVNIEYNKDFSDQPIQHYKIIQLSENINIIQ